MQPERAPTVLACWHENQRESSTSLGTGKLLEVRITCQDCGLVKVLKPCSACGQLTEKVHA